MPLAGIGFGSDQYNAGVPARCNKALGAGEQIVISRFDGLGFLADRI